MGDLFGPGCTVAFLLILCAGATGWVMNVVKVFEHINEPITLMEVVRVICVFLAPLGAIIGWL